MDAAYVKRVDIEFMKAGVRGISILVASGDDGAGCAKSAKVHARLNDAHPDSY